MKTSLLPIAIALLAVAARFASVATADPAPESTVAAQPGQAAGCTSARCTEGLKLAYEHAVSDESECPLLSSHDEEIKGCRVFVAEGLGTQRVAYVPPAWQ